MAIEETKVAQARVWAWDHYWRDGRLASCGGEGGMGYQEAIARGWHEFFCSLPEDSHILDVCSGNGAIARVAERSANERGKRFAIDAVDAAQLVPPGFEANGMIRFHSRVAAESLPFPDASFDVVVGQYAIEYTDLTRSLPELARVSRAACQLRFVIHAREGIVVRGARDQLAEVSLLRDSGIFVAAKSLAEVQGGVAPPGESLQQLQQRYETATRQLTQAAARSVEAQMFTNTLQVLNHALSVQAQVGMPTVIAKIAEVSQSITAHATRLHAMVEAAIDEHGATDLADRIGKLWSQKLRVQACSRTDGALLGWALQSVG